MKRVALLLAALGWVGCGPSEQSPPDPTVGSLTPTEAEDADGDGFAVDVDCDDTNADIHPDAIDLCDGVDNDCDLQVDGSAAATVGEENFESVTAALTAASESAVIAVCPGDHAIPSRALAAGDDLTLISSMGAENTSLAETNGNAAIFQLDAGAALTIDGFSISGHSVPALLANGGTLTVRRSVLHDNTDSVIVGEPLGAVAVTVRVEDSRFENNTAPGDGGAIRLNERFELQLVGSTFADNTAVRGGALFVRSVDSFGQVVLTDTVIEDNTAAQGGGIAAIGMSLEGVGDTRVLNNTATVSGGGIYLARTEASNLTVMGNDAPLGGGIIAAYEPELAGLPIATMFTDGVLEGNTAQQGAGAAVDALESLHLQDTQVLANTASMVGGGAFLGFPFGFLVSDSSDWAGDANDNQPDDVYAASSAPPEPPAGSSFSGYASGETFSCSAAGCSPAP